ncbi:hypothetical protein ABIE65_002474 [Constrictibacter sp. MBR-5]|uniref:hypothetical protein n=1 Tax=Constrictibacter sp. MBR-5 TaxID=3156467 RepID=UPI00339A769D
MDERHLPSPGSAGPHASDGDAVHIELLTVARVAQAYPLARFCNPALTYDDWAALCHDASPTAGTLLVVCGRGYIRAICRFTAQRTLQHGYALFLDDLASGHPLDPARFAPLLIRQAEEHARSLGCTTLLTRVPHESAWLRHVLETEGHKVAGTCFAKAIAHR